MKALITGGLGFLGSNLALRLVEDGHSVILLDLWRGNKANIEGFEDRVDVIYGDIRDGALVSDLVKGVNVVFHLASQVSHVKSMEDPFIDVDVNCRGTLTILEAIRKHAPLDIPLVFASSRSVYGFPDYLPIDEGHPTRPIDAYGITKLAGEKYCELYNYHYGLKTVCLRQANLFGERQQLWTREYQMIGWVFRRTLLEEPLEFYGDGEQTRDFLYIGDSVEVFLKAYENIDRTAGETYNLCGRDYCAWNKVFEVCSEVVGKPAHVEYKEYPPLRRRLENPHSQLSGDKAFRDFGWKPKVGLREGFKKMMEYYLNPAERIYKYTGG